MNLRQQNTRPFYPALTGIRIIAAWLIFLHHYPSFLVNTVFEPLIKEFHVGIFFTLSGFLTYQLYFEKFKSGDFNFKPYIFNRLLRLYPIYLVLLVVTAIWKWESIQAFILSLTLTQTFFDNYKFAYIAQAWTLNVQLSFYLMVLVFFYFLKKSKHAFWLFPLLLSLIGMSIVFISDFVRLGSFFSTTTFMMIYTFFGRSSEFFIGMFAAFLLLSKPKIDWTKLKPTLFGGIAYLIFIAIVAGFQSEEFAYGIFHPLGMALHHVIMPFAVGLLLIGLCGEQTWFSRILSVPFMILLGNSAYAFYLIHLGLVPEIIYFHISKSPILFFLLLNMIAILVYKFFELPISRYLRIYKK